MRGRSLSRWARPFWASLSVGREAPDRRQDSPRAWPRAADTRLSPERSGSSLEESRPGADPWDRRRSAPSSSPRAAACPPCPSRTRRGPGAPESPSACKISAWCSPFGAKKGPEACRTKGLWVLSCRGGTRISKALFRRQEEYEMDLWVVKYASRRSRIGDFSGDSSVRGARIRAALSPGSRGLAAPGPGGSAEGGLCAVLVEGGGCGGGDGAWAGWRGGGGGDTGGPTAALVKHDKNLRAYTQHPKEISEIYH